MAVKAILVAVLMFVASVAGDQVNDSENEILSSRDNVVITDTLSDGEVERRVRFNGVSAKETAVALDASGNATAGVKLWQAAQGKKFIQLIYDANGRLLDCEYVQNAEMARQFIEQFDAESETYVDKFHLRDGNVTVKHVRLLGDIDRSIRDLINYRGLRRSCKRLHRYVRKFRQEELARSSNATVAGDDDAGRQRRDVLMLVRVPGTQWCGVGSRAEHVNDLGGFSIADNCCRIHDLECPYYIPTLTENYGLYNWRAYTLNHCDCDER